LNHSILYSFPFDHVFGATSTDEKSIPLLLVPMIEDLLTLKPSTLLAVGGLGSSVWTLGNDLTTITSALASPKEEK
jgi:hypothetical protein